MADDRDSAQAGPKRIIVSQAEIPNENLQSALRIAQAIWENFAGKSAPPHSIAMALDFSPTSGRWRNLCGSSLAYGLTEGGYNAAQIALTDLGRRIVAPTEDGESERAVVEALMKPRIQREFFQKYNRAKFPKDEIGRNVLVTMGLPKDRSEQAFEILKENGQFAGIIQHTKTGLFVAVDTPAPSRTVEGLEPSDHGNDLTVGRYEDIDLEEMRPVSPTPVAAELPSPVGNRVFLTHGKNKKILEQVKELVAYGKFEPVIAQERETAAKPVPEKVMGDMRSCQAAVIHVGIDEMLFDSEGNERPQINGNVLIEIGAAMALYGKNFILLVEEGVSLPSNLQGLYECRYKGDELNMTATMKLLKAFNDFDMRTLKAR
jgi:predicted nucleotide-binding protein